MIKEISFNRGANTKREREFEMVFLLRAACLWGSVFGYCAFGKKHMNPAFTPIVTMSSIGVLLFLAGFLNIMTITVALIVLGGWICLIRCKPWQKSFYAGNKSLFWMFLIFSIICSVFLLRIYKQIPVHYDCFSHWLTVVREMIETDSMPNFKSSTIAFQGYPTGAAGFIYFICKVLGNSRDDLVLFAQAILYAAAIMCFAAFVKHRDVFAILIAIVGSFFCITAHSSALEYLLVDTLISFVSIGVIAIIIYYRHELMKGVLLSLPLQLFLVAIKNSGIIMVALNFGLVIALAVASDYNTKRKISILNIVKLGGLTAGAPAVLYYLWMQHVEYVFSAGTLTKHTASLENYKHVLSGKSEEQIEEILQVFFERFMSWNIAWLLLIIVSGILLTGWLIKKCVLKQNSKSELFIFIAIISAYFLFMGVLAVMYLVSMPYGESIVLASYDRYEKTILVYIIGAITIYALYLASLFPGYKKVWLIKAFVLLALSLTLLNQTANIKAFLDKKDIYTSSSRHVMEQLKSDFTVPEGKRYFIYGARCQSDASYHYYLARYIFWSSNVHTCNPEDFDKHKNSITDYDYLIILDQDPEIEEFLRSSNVDVNKKVYTIEGTIK